jgi:hypothetical protein
MNLGRKALKKTLLPLLAILALFVLPATAFADTFGWYVAPTTAGNGNTATDNPWETDYAGGDQQFDLDHHKAYVWNLSGLSVPSGHTITSATLRFKDISNWDTNPNILYVHLLNYSSVGGATGNVVDNSGDTLNGDYFNGANALGPTLGANNIKLFEVSFNKVGQNGYNEAVDYVYNFTPAQLATLAAFINAGGTISFGFDPDCHYWNDGIIFQYTTAVAPVPEPMSMILLGSGLAGLYIRRRRQRA